MWDIEVVNQEIVLSLSLEDKTANEARIAAEAAAAIAVLEAAEASASASEANESAILAQEAAASIGSGVTSIPMAMLSEGDNDFVVVASIIARPTGSITNGVPIVWSILDDETHTPSFYRQVFGDPSTQELRVRFPKVKKVLSWWMMGDEDFVKRSVQFGARVGLVDAQIVVGYKIPCAGRLNGNGTSWTITGTESANIVLNSFSGGTTFLNYSANIQDFNAQSVVVAYHGTNNYRVVRVFAGLGSSPIAFKLVDNTTNATITTAPTSSDIVLISNVGLYFRKVQMYTWATTDQNTTNSWMGGGFANFWSGGSFEVWMKSFPISDTEMKIIWQSKSGVTTYKLRRSTAFTVDVNGDYVLTSPVEIYSGTGLEFIDTGLTSDTMYYYQLLDQSDVEITQFNSKTK